ncbi:hypothetical protein QFC24_006620 [Naganishia onofrii]|uniref:Uncharacterized protein n=1 Tax=Naganishia onofrii TaxID=1851511 RepID=A0ACC2WYE1_9TREE|nr:hypothetical protein QFC24_006620 [Naganishia onofrii]
MKRKPSRVPLWPLFLLATCLVSPVIAFAAKSSNPTPVCRHDDDSACEWTLFESPSAVTTSLTATIYTSGFSATGSPTASVTPTPPSHNTTSPSIIPPASTRPPSSPTAVLPVIRQAAETTHGDGCLPRTNDDGPPQSNETDNQHREGSSKNPSADALIGLDNDDDANFSRNGFNETHLARNDLERDSFAGQGFFGFTVGKGTRGHQKHPVAGLAVRRMGDVVVGPHFGYVVHCDLVEVPVVWTRSDYVSIADAATKAQQAETQRAQHLQMDMDERENQRRIDHEALMSKQRNDFQTLTQKIRQENDARELQRQQEHGALIAEAEKFKEEYEQLVKIWQILLDRTRTRYLRAAQLSILALCFLLTSLAVFSWIILCYGIFRRVNLALRRGIKSSKGSSQPPDDGPPPSDAPTAPNNSSLPHADGSEPDASNPTTLNNDMTASNDDEAPSDDDAPSSDGDAPPSREDTPRGNEDVPQDSMPLVNAEPLVSDDAAAPLEDLVPPIDHEEQQAEAAEQQPEVDMSMEAIRRRIALVYRRTGRQRRNGAITAPTSSSTAKRSRSACSEPAPSCENTVSFNSIVNSKAAWNSAIGEGVTRSETVSMLAAVSVGVQTDSIDVPKPEDKASATGHASLPSQLSVETSRSKDTDSVLAALPPKAVTPLPKAPATPPQSRASIDVLIQRVKAEFEYATQERQQLGLTALIPVDPSSDRPSIMSPLMHQVPDAPSPLRPAVMSARPSIWSGPDPGMMLLRRALDSASRPVLGMGAFNDVVPTVGKQSAPMQEEKVTVSARLNPSASATPVHTSANSVGPKPVNRLATQLVPAVVKSVGPQANDPPVVINPPVNTNGWSEARPGLTYAGAAIATSANDECQAGPSRGFGPYATIDAGIFTGNHNPKYYREDGSKKTPRSKRGSGLVKKAAKAEAARLRMEAEMGNSDVGSEGVGDGIDDSEGAFWR